MDAAIGGRYAVCAEIAAGGMATVSLARQIGAAGFTRIVAVKRLHERFARDPEFVGMFLDEARLVARIRHPNVVQTVDVVAEGGEVFIVMEYVHGDSLMRATQLARRAGELVPPPIAAAIVAGALHGLHEAHEARSATGAPLGIVHRDVSPQNVLVGADGVARVLDFGVAKASERIQTTRDGQLKGKLSYMAPEQVRSEDVDRRTDVYAAAVVLWETLTGSKLFGGGNEAAVIHHLLFEKVRPPSALAPAVTPALDAVVMRGLARDRAERFATAREMALALESAVAIATPSEVGAWLSRTCEKTVSARAALIGRIEASTSASGLREAVDSLRQITSAPRDSAASLPPVAGRSAPPKDVSTVGFDLSIARVRRRSPAVAIAAGLAVVAALVAVVGAGAWLLRARTKLADAGPRGAALASADAPSGPAVEPARCPEGTVLVPGGRFFMGSDDDRPEEKPAHKVTLHAYCMDIHEVTADAYRACSDRGDCKRAGTTNKWDGLTKQDARAYDPLCTISDPSRGAHPINCVDWDMADRFCRAQGKRLPTEAEWEFAARGSDGRKYPWGDDPPSSKLLNACGAECLLWGKKHGSAQQAMYEADDGFATTAPVGSFPLGASRWGVEDVVGNVWEWTADWYGPYAPEDAADPRGPAAGATRVIRGGAWNGGYADWVRPTFRFHDAPTTRSHGIGFRCAKDT